MHSKVSFFKKPMLIGWLLVAAASAQAATYYVSPTGNDANNGTSWPLAKQTIQAAINVAASGDTILVADGTYAPITITPGIAVRSVNGAQTTIIDGGGVTRCVYLDTDAVLDGFTVTSGYTYDALGGGVFSWGGTVQNCTISGNSAGWDGGGVFAYGGTVENCTISGNSASSGGGVCGERVTVQNCTISGNRAAFYGGGVENDWGGIVRDCTISGNLSGADGGGAFLRGGTVENCTISGNSAGWDGGGILVDYLGKVQNCAISGNSATYSGGGVFVDWNSTVRNCKISGNLAEWGGGVFVWSGTLENCTISGNLASDGGGILVDYLGKVQNCISYYNQNGDVFGPISYSCVGVGMNSHGNSPAAGNITNEPQFVSTGMGYGANLEPGNYRLQPASPCINAGLNQSWMATAVDLDGLPRIFDSVVDMGAYEFNTNPGTVQFNASSYSVNESAGTVTLTVTRTGGNFGPASVDYTTANGTATAGADYTSNSGTLSWSDRDRSSKALTVSITDDSIDEENETFTVMLSNAVGAGLGSPSSVIVTIVDNDETPAEYHADIEVAEFKWVPKKMRKLKHPSVISFVLRNEGPADMQAPGTAVEERFYLSGNMIFGDGDDIRVGTKQGEVTLTAGEQTTMRYTGQAHNTDVTIPDGISGDYYVFVSVVHVLPSGLIDPDGAYAMRDGPITIGEPPDGKENEGRHRPAVVNDYDGDGQSDMMAYDETSGAWVIQLSASGASEQFVFGGPGYEAVPGDYDGDFKADPAVHYKQGSQWHILLSGFAYQTISFDFGAEAETRGVIGDYDGDTMADPGLYEEKSGRWYVLLPNLERGKYEIVSALFGGPGWTPVAEDYDGDGRADPGLYEEVTGKWRVMLSDKGYGVVGAVMGGSGYRAVPGDYDGDGRTDPAVVSTSGEWYYWLSSRGYSLSGPDTFGKSGRPVPGDYDGDGKSDPAIMDSSGNWYFWLSGSFYIRAGPYSLTLP